MKNQRKSYILKWRYYAILKVSNFVLTVFQNIFIYDLYALKVKQKKRTIFQNIHQHQAQHFSVSETV